MVTSGALSSYDIGTVIHDKYELTDLLGRGGMGVVFPPSRALIANSMVRTWASIWCDCIPLEKWAADLRGRTKLPIGVAFFMPLFFDMFGSPWPCLYTHLPLSWMGGSGPDFAFADRFSEACNYVGHFRPEVNPAGPAEAA